MDVDALVGSIEDAQRNLARAAEMPSMRKDPYRLVIAGLSDTLSALAHSVARMEGAAQSVIDARAPLADEEKAALTADVIQATEKGAYEGMRKEARRMIRGFDRRSAVRVGLAVGGAYAVGGASVVALLFYLHMGPFSPSEAWRTLVANNPDPRGALAAADIRTDHGRRYYGNLSLWLDGPAQPNGSK